MGENLFNNLKEIEEEVKLDRTLSGFFDRCFKLNKFPAKHNYFLKFFERRNVYRFLVKKKVQGKNEVTRNLSNSVLEKFKDYEMIRNDLSFNEKVEVIPIDIVCEPIYDETIPVPCYFTSLSVYQCYYCQNFFCKKQGEHEKTFVCL